LYSRNSASSERKTKGTGHGLVGADSQSIHLYCRYTLHTISIT